MEAKQILTDEDWQATPEPVKQYIKALEKINAQLLSKIDQLEKRIEALENKSNKNSQNSSKPPSSDSPYKRPKKKTSKSRRKRGAQKGHKGYRQEQLDPTEKKHILPESCDCGCQTIIPGSLKPYYTHQVIELPEIDMDVLHIILNRGTCCHCGKTVKAVIPKEHRTGYGPRFSALIAEMSGIQGIDADSLNTPTPYLSKILWGDHIKDFTICKETK